MSDLTRRDFLRTSLAGLAAGALVGCSRSSAAIPGEVLGASSKIGHLLRTGKFPKPSEGGHLRAVIVGGGIAGLSAAWALSKSGFRDFCLLELENETGGNARGGQNAVSAYPWGAHYVPLLNPESTDMHELFRDLGIIEGYDTAGLPIYNEYAVSFPPRERLFIHGRWQDSLEPHLDLPTKDEAQFETFWSLIETFKKAVGTDGRRAFAIPIDLSSRDPVYLQLDQITIADYLRQHLLDSPYLNWYVNYCCRDDYGAGMDLVSAWAGIHYFASRIGTASNASPSSVITWPEGNAHLARALRDKVSAQIRTNALVYHIETNGYEAVVDFYDPVAQKATRLRTDAVIFAAPRFTSSYVIPQAPVLAGFTYSPWMVANLTLSQPPVETVGARLSWDNVIYDSSSLGYVVATHQNLERYVRGTVFTYYWPYSDANPAAQRQMLLQRSHEEWAEIILKDLEAPHPDIRSLVQNIDVWPWGHGMIRPNPGFIWGASRAAALQPFQNIHFAHSDMSGISIFEEANYHGVQAAQAVLKKLSS